MEHELTAEETAFLAGWFAGRGIEGDPTIEQLTEAIEALASYKEDRAAGHG